MPTDKPSNTPLQRTVPNYTFEELKDKQVYVRILENEDNPQDNPTDETEIEVYFIQNHSAYLALANAIYTYGAMGVLGEVEYPK
jgi:hypothetical protein